MPRTNRVPRTRRELCGEFSYDDGSDPRLQRREPSRRHQPNYKNHQLCRQIEQTLNLVLSGEFEDTHLHNLFVESVRPAPDASQMLVTVRDLSGDVPDPIAVLTRLERVRGHLRSRIAGAISRKRAPRLLFQVTATNRRPDAR